VKEKKHFMTCVSFICFIAVLFALRFCFMFFLCSYRSVNCISIVVLLNSNMGQILVLFVTRLNCR